MGQHLDAASILFLALYEPNIQVIPLSVLLLVKRNVIFRYKTNLQNNQSIMTVISNTCSEHRRIRSSTLQGHNIVQMLTWEHQVHLWQVGHH